VIPIADTVEQPAADDVVGVPVLVIRVLGPLQVEGLRSTVRRRALIRLLVAVAVSGRPVGVEELRDVVALHPDKPHSATDVHSFASKLRGHLPAGVLPPIPVGAMGYQLADTVEIDWAEFQALTVRAEQVDGPDRVELSMRALRLVRGQPLAHGSWAGIEPEVSRIETRIERFAADTARYALDARDARSAEMAVTQGLLVAPGSLALWELRLIAAVGGSGIGLDRAWTMTRNALGPDADTLANTYERLRTGQY